jgi:hypothetical protein
VQWLTDTHRKVDVDGVTDQWTATDWGRNHISTINALSFELTDAVAAVFDDSKACRHRLKSSRAMPNQQTHEKL